MSNKPLSKILLAALFTAAVDFVSEANDERKRAKLRETQLESQLADQMTFSKRLTSEPSKPNKSRDNGKIQKEEGDKYMHDEKDEKDERDERDEREASGFGPGLLLGSLIGSVIGAGLAFWYAPQTGKKTQAMLKREVNQLQKQVNKKANHLYATAEEMANDAANRASDLTEQGREFIEEKASTLKKAAAR